MENLDAFLALRLLKKPLVEPIRVFSNTSLFEPAEFRSPSSVHGYQNHNVLSHPPGVKPQRPLNSETKQLLQMHKHNIHSQHINNTHRHPHNTHSHAGKTTACIKMANACIYKVFLSTVCNKVSAPSSSLYS
jgi:hypothetical protein